MNEFNDSTQYEDIISWLGHDWLADLPITSEGIVFYCDKS
jgi:hypothetical protein